MCIYWAPTVCQALCWTALFMSLHLILRAKRWSQHYHLHFIGQTTGSEKLNNFQEITSMWLRHPWVTFSLWPWTFSNIYDFYYLENLYYLISLCGPGNPWWGVEYAFFRLLWGSTSSSYAWLTMGRVQAWRWQGWECGAGGVYCLSQGRWSPGFPHHRIWLPAAAGFHDAQMSCFGSFCWTCQHWCLMSTGRLAERPSHRAGSTSS